MSDPTPIITSLDRAGYRLTEPRLALATLIAEQDGHFTAAGLVSSARARRLGVGRATVFRTLETLEEIGAIERLDLPSGEHATYACSPDGRSIRSTRNWSTSTRDVCQCRCAATSRDT